MKAHVRLQAARERAFLVTQGLFDGEESRKELAELVRAALTDAYERQAVLESQHADVLVAVRELMESLGRAREILDAKDLTAAELVGAVHGGE